MPAAAPQANARKFTFVLASALSSAHFAASKAEHGDSKAKDKVEEALESGSDQDFSDSDDEGADGYKRGEWVLSSLHADLHHCMHSYIS